MRKLAERIRDTWDCVQVVLLLGLLQLGEICCGRGGDEFDP